MDKILFVVFLLSQICLAQFPDKDFYQLYQGSKKYPKIVKYILAPLDETNVAKEEGVLRFYVFDEIFIHYTSKHIVETISTSELNNLNFSSIRELLDEDRKIYYKRREEHFLENGFNLPPSLGYDYFKISLVLVEKENLAKVYEVYWLYSN